MHLHLVEPRADGHRMQYVRRLVEAAPRDWTLSLSTFPSSCEHPGLQAVLAAGGPRLSIQAIDGEADFERRVRGTDGFALQPAYWRLFRRHWADLTSQARGDLAVVPYLDYCSYAIGLLGSPFGETPFAGIVMRQDFHWPEQGVKAPPPKHALLKRWLFLRLLRHRRLTRLVTIDPSLRDWVTQRQQRGQDRLHYAVDPADMQGSGGRLEARQRFGLNAGATVVLLFGFIDLRKGLESLLQVAGSPGFPTDGQVLIVGQQSEEARVRIRAAAALLPTGRLICVDRYVDRQDEWAAFAAADLVWVAYDGFYGSSGVLAQASQVRLPLIHRGEGLIDYQLAPVMPVPTWLSVANLKLGNAPDRPADDSQGLAQVLAD